MAFSTTRDENVESCTPSETDRTNVSLPYGRNGFSRRVSLDVHHAHRVMYAAHVINGDLKDLYLHPLGVLGHDIVELHPQRCPGNSTEVYESVQGHIVTISPRQTRSEGFGHCARPAGQLQGLMRVHHQRDGRY